MADFIWGVIAPDGTIKSGSTDSRSGSYEFSVEKTGTGTYAITFSSAFNALPAITGSQVLWGATNENALDNVVFPEVSSATATAITGNSSGAAADRHFSFIAAGPSDR